mgnify:CR=1 FL=1
MISYSGKKHMKLVPVSLRKLMPLLCVLLVVGCARKKKLRKRAVPVPAWTEEDTKKQPELQPESVKGTESVDDSSIELPPTDDPGEIEFDRIEAIVEGINAVERIATTDIKRRSFDGAEHSLDSIIDERLASQRGQEMKMDVTDDDIDRYLSMRQGMPVSKEYLTEMARVQGYTLEEFYDELKRLQRSNNYMDYEVQARMDIPEDDIKKHFDVNPVMEEAVYFIQTTFVPFDENKTEAQQVRELRNPNVRMSLSLDWTVPIDLKASEVESDKEFILTMKKNNVFVLQDQDGFTLFRLYDKVDEKPVPFEDRKLDILNELRQQRFVRIIDDIKKDLRKNTSVYYLHDDEAEATK